LPLALPVFSYRVSRRYLYSPLRIRWAIVAGKGQIGHFIAINACDLDESYLTHINGPNVLHSGT